MAKMVTVTNGVRTRTKPEHVAKIMIAQHGFYLVDEKPVILEDSIPEVKQKLRESDNLEWLEAQLQKEKGELNRASIIKVAEKRIAELKAQ